MRPVVLLSLLDRLELPGPLEPPGSPELPVAGCGTSTCTGHGCRTSRSK